MDDYEIIECEEDGCNKKIRFGDELRDANYKGMLKGGGKAGGFGLFLLYTVAKGAPVAVITETVPRVCDRIGINVPDFMRPPSEQAAKMTDRQLVGATNKEYKKLEEEVNGWDWYIRAEYGGGVVGPYCPKHRSKYE